MGVPRLFPWLTGTFPDIVRQIKKGYFAIEVDNLYIDSQSILHSACQTIFNYGQKKRLMDPFHSLTYKEKQLKVFALFFQTIVEIAKMVRPRKTLYISNDGPAPLAKQSQQRQRRFESAMSRGGSEFDSTSLTPGTEFMFELTKYLHYAIRNELQTNEAWKKLNVIFSGCSDPGEGEHKLLVHIRNLPKDVAQRQTHCIVGPDGDLIMLALSAHVKNVYLLREDLEVVDVYHLVNMGKVREELPKLVFPPPPFAVSVRGLDDVTNDFVFIGFLVGNDFLPKVQMFMYLEDGLELMIKEYVTLYQRERKYLTTDARINGDIFLAFIKRLAASEVAYLEAQIPYSRHLQGMTDPAKLGWGGQAPIQSEPGLKATSSIFIPGPIRSEPSRPRHFAPKESAPEFIDYTLLNNLDSNERLNFGTYRQAYYLKSDIDVTTEGGKEGLRLMCRDYLKTIIWVGEYYIRGLPSWDHYYPWHYPPLMTDLYEVLTTSDFQELSTFVVGSPSLPFVQLLCVLPPKSVNQLPPPFRHLMLDPDSPLVKANTYPETFKIDYEGKTKKHFGIALLSFADVELVRKCYVHMMGLIIAKVGEQKANTIYQRNHLKRAKVFYYDPDFSATYKSSYGTIKINVRDKVLE